jgi:hypothetical protein
MREVAANRQFSSFPCSGFITGFPESGRGAPLLTGDDAVEQVMPRPSGDGDDPPFHHTWCWQATVARVD